MGRMDDAAKRKVVELRNAGLSFRKIKAVLELEDIRVSAQTIYMFLREFQGRPPGRVGPVESGHTVTVNIRNRASGLQESHIRDVSQHSRPETNTQANEQRTEQQSEGGEKKESEIKIVSVTSLASNVRRRVTPSPANSSMLAAGKKLLDRALSQRMKATTLLRRDQSSVQGSSLRTAAPQRVKDYAVSTEKSGLEPEGSAPRKITFPRPAVSARSPNLLPRVGVQLPNQSTAPLMTTGKSLINLLSPDGPARNERNPQQQAVQDSRGRDGLQDQIQSLGVEVRSLGLAVKVLMEQQSRMEKEQAEQTNIQKQILKTLQLLASRQEPSSATKRQNKQHSPPFSQDAFSFNQSSFSSCSQPSYGSLDTLESVEPFGLSPPSMNGFLPCSGADSLPLTQTYAGSYPQQSGQTLLPPYTQAFSTFTQAQVGKRAEYQNNDRTLKAVTSEPQLSTIKVEGP